MTRSKFASSLVIIMAKNRIVTPDGVIMEPDGKGVWRKVGVLDQNFQRRLLEELTKTLKLERDIAKELGVSEKTLHKLRGEYGIPPAYEHRRDERRRRVLSMLEQGRTHDSIAHELGISKGTLHADVTALRKDGRWKFQRTSPPRQSSMS